MAIVYTEFLDRLSDCIGNLSRVATEGLEELLDSRDSPIRRSKLMHDFGAPIRQQLTTQYKWVLQRQLELELETIHGDRLNYPLRRMLMRTFMDDDTDTYVDDAMRIANRQGQFSTQLFASLQALAAATLNVTDE